MATNEKDLAGQLPTASEGASGLPDRLAQLESLLGALPIPPHERSAFPGEAVIDMGTGKTPPGEITISSFCGKEGSVEKVVVWMYSGG